jgi:cell division protein FtsB
MEVIKSKRLRKLRNNLVRKCSKSKLVINLLAFKLVTDYLGIMIKTVNFAELFIMEFLNPEL